MALHVEWFAGADKRTGQTYGRFISAESVSVSGTTASSGNAPEQATIARVVAGEACYVTNKGASPTAVTVTGGALLYAAGSEIQLEVNPGDKIAVIS